MKIITADIKNVEDEILEYFEREDKIENERKNQELLCLCNNKYELDNFFSDSCYKLFGKDDWELIIKILGFLKRKIGK